MKKIADANDEEVVHDDEDEDEVGERITADELDFFHGSTTFGRQVAELSGSSRRSRRKSF